MSGENMASHPPCRSRAAWRACPPRTFCRHTAMFALSARLSRKQNTFLLCCVARGREDARARAAQSVCAERSNGWLWALARARSGLAMDTEWAHVPGCSAALTELLRLRSGRGHALGQRKCPEQSIVRNFVFAGVFRDRFSSKYGVYYITYFTLTCLTPFPGYLRFHNVIVNHLRQVVSKRSPIIRAQGYKSRLSCFRMRGVTVD